MIKKIRIIHTADMQYKNRTHDLQNSYEKVSEAIEKILIDTKADVYAFAGDFTEYPTPNDSERSMMFKHLGNVLNINTLKEMVVMNGNHDLVLGKKVEVNQKENNPLDTFVKTTKALNPEVFKKINYLKKQQEYDSIVSDLISWVSYSLEDGTSSGSNLKLKESGNNKYRIPVFHDILKEYVDDKKLPVSKSKYDFLMKLDDFKTNPNQKGLIICGDIHENWNITTTIGDKYFLYPGSPIQRNHGEGSYFKVKPSGPQIKIADKKVVKQIDIFIDTENINNTYYEITDIELPNTLHYIKFDLNTKKFVDNWKEQLTHLLSQVQHSINVNIIKIELSNIYMKYEMEIIAMINDFFEKKNSECSCINYIELAYGQVVFDKDDIVIDEEVKELDDNGEEIETEEISLNQEKLKNIFQRILDANNQNILKEFTNPEEFQEIVDELQSLFEEQLELTYGSKTAYHTDLLKVETTGFMALGANEIELDIPGLTRIDGNNGIGKTTLFNLLRWIIKGVVLDGLPKNTKKENLLLVFNDELPSQDYLHNVLYLRVNDIPVEIERTARRTWKKSATEADKKSLNWKTFIDTATTNLTLRVSPKDKDVVVKVNDEAQNLINQWFGNTIETIFILNQFKILQLLNSSGEELKETVLDYIGVDFVKALIGNLEIVKPNYMVAKPDKAQMEIIVEKNKTTQQISESKEKILDLSSLISNAEEIKVINENSITAKNQELIDLGNVPELINKVTQSIDTFQVKKDSFEVKESKIIPIFDKIEPLKPDTSEVELQIVDLTKQIKQVDTDIESNTDLFNTEKRNKVNTVNENITKFVSENENILIEAKQKFTTKINEIVPEIKEMKLQILNELNASLNNGKETEQKLLKETTDKINELKMQRNEVVNKFNTLKSEIDNDICSGCKRPIGLTPEMIDEKKSEMESIQISVKMFDENITGLQTQVVSVNNSISLIDNRLKDISMLMNWQSSMSSLRDFESDLEVIDKNNSVFFGEKDNTKLLRLLNEGKDAWNVFNNAESDEKFISNKTMVDKFNVLMTKLATININTVITEDLKSIKFIESLFVFIETINSLINKKTELNNVKDSTKSKLDKTLQDYYNELKIYNDSLASHNKLVGEVNDYNTSIIEHNKLPIEWDNNIKRLEIELENHKNNKYYYEKYRNEIDELKEGLDKIVTDVDNWKTQSNTLEKNIVLYEQNLITLNELEEKWKQFRKKNFIYKTYEKLIKNDFKYAIFNYYRQFLNTKLNILLEGLNFRLYWNNDSNLYMVKLSKGQDGNTEMVYRPVKVSSGMQTAFLGLSLVYSFHLLNIKNSISHIFVDEISGQLNSGKNKGTTDDEVIDDATKKNYQEQLVMLLSKFDKKKVFIIDHVIDNLYETHTYNVKRKEIDGNIVTVYD